MNWDSGCVRIMKLAKIGKFLDAPEVTFEKMADHGFIHTVGGYPEINFAQSRYSVQTFS
jgi:hypothetical protein